MEARERKWNVLYGGDFNCGFEGILKTKVEAMQLTPTGNTAEPSWRNAVTATRIDHIFYGGEDVIEAWGGPKEMAMVFTDHMPMFGVYKVPTKAEESPTVRFQLWPDLKRGDEKAIKTSKQRLRECR